MNDLIKEMSLGKEVFWQNSRATNAKTALAKLPLGKSDIDDAEARLLRFAPYIAMTFPETQTAGGIIESPLEEIPNMQKALGGGGKLFLKRDDMLAVAGSVKARGGVYEVLKHSEDLLLKSGILKSEKSDYKVFASEEAARFFAGREIHVGSTGNLGLSIGIMSAKLGYKVTVHMSSDAKTWKKELLRSYGAIVKEYQNDYGAAVAQGREEASKNPLAYFVDDENSKDLFLGYAVSARRLKGQLATLGIFVDDSHKLNVYIPCGVGGAPCGICFGLKHEFGDCVNVYFAEPTNSPCMTLGLACGLHNKICVQDIGLSGKTLADGLAVGRASAFAGRMVEELVSGAFTLQDETFIEYMKMLYSAEGIFIEPSACAGFKAYTAINSSDTHIVWSTGGSLVPQSEREKYLSSNVL